MQSDYAAGMKNRLYILLFVPLLAACQGDDVRNTFGLEREAPDEFVVYSRPPLSLPPEFELRPPTPGEPPRLSEDSRDKARNAVLGTETDATKLEAPFADTGVSPVLESDAKSSAEANLLTRSGAAKADPDIREILQKTDPEARQDSKSLFDQIIKSEGHEPVVDAKKEVERIRKNKIEGKPVNEGEVPTLDTKPKTVLDKIF